MPSDLAPDSVTMYNEGVAWANDNINHKKDVHVVNNGLNLYGEYYDFGFDCCAFILSGRTEALKYSYYFAQSYYKKCNVLVVDPRAHGLSDGEFNTVGFEESKDIIAWVKYIHDEFNIKSFVFHGICIGAAGGILALTNEECPSYVKGIVTEGMFANFALSLENHLKERNKPAKSITKLMNRLFKKHTGHDMYYGPIDIIDKLDVPLLMLHSKEDTYSTPDYAIKLFEKAKTNIKKIVWFDHGRHSFLRITDTELYNKSIEDFLENTLEFK